MDGQRGQKAQWSRIGVVFAREHGDRLTLTLHSVPVNFDGRIVMRAPKPEQEPVEGV